MKFKIFIITTVLTTLIAVGSASPIPSPQFRGLGSLFSRLSSNFGRTSSKLTTGYKNGQFSKVGIYPRPNGFTKAEKIGIATGVGGLGLSAAAVGSTIQTNERVLGEVKEAKRKQASRAELAAIATGRYRESANLVKNVL